MKKNSILEKLNKDWIFFDGGTGSVLQSLGLQAGELPETWNLSHPDEVVSLHEGYLNAGSTVINTNTFGANRLKYGSQLSEIVNSAVRLAKKARMLAGREQDAYIALDIGPTGRLLEPMGDLPFEEAVSIFFELAHLGYEAGADLILIETMNDSYEAKAAVLGAKEACELPVFITMVFDENGKMLTGGTPESMTAMLEGLHVDALGINCSLGPRQMLPIVKRFAACSSTPLIVNPNAGLPRVENGKTLYDLGADEFASVMREIALLGVQGVGGCCGTTPEYIRKTISLVSPLPFSPVRKKHHTVLSSFSQCLCIEDAPVLIGERINPTGKKKLKEALQNHDLEYVLSQGLAQEDAGAHILDVNVGLPGIDEKELMTEVITRLQSICALPLQIDTSNPSVLEKALRIYNGKAMINSINGKQESMDSIFPLAAKYGGVLVALPLDENGIPDNADKRLEIAQRIYNEAAKYGIPREDIVIDGLCMTVSSDPLSALTTLETIRRVRDELSGKSILGVSNISFGLPARELLNASFFTMAMHSGLSCAIINPNNEAMMQAYRSFLALTGKDQNFQAYISAYKDYTVPKIRDGKAPSASESSDSKNKPKVGNGNENGAAPLNSPVSSAFFPLYEAIRRGMAQSAAAETKKCLNNEEAMELVDGCLVPALDSVGKDFEKGIVFLPQLLMAAEAAQAAFSVVKDSMANTAGIQKGTVILATVKGDIHDIGKNIVKVMLENYGYSVIDLGRDVAPERIVDTAIENCVPVVGLSALMTTTVPSMEETIRQLRLNKPDTKVVVGGAVLTKEYAEKIGADYYAKDAMATVRFCDMVYKKE